MRVELGDGEFVKMASTEHPIYLDHNATTPVHPAVVEAMLPYLRDHFGNPSSGHVYGQRAKHAVERAREQVASLLGCQHRVTLPSPQVGDGEVGREHSVVLQWPGPVMPLL